MVRQQKTIKQEFVLEGQGLHTGSNVKATFKPAPPNSGIKFIRVDLSPPVEVPATVDSIPESADANRNTSISHGESTIYTVEHILSTCYALGVDNLTIEIDGNEPPEPPEGNYLGYVKAFQQNGFESQGAPADIFKVDRAVTLREGDIEITATPADTFRVSFTIQYDEPGIGTQYATYDVTPETYEKELASARTFVLMEDVEKLREQGLIKGGSIHNALVFEGGEVKSDEPLRYPNEPVRHKLLDLIGDLSLLGAPIQGHVHAVKSGHASNVRFVRKLREIQKLKKRTAMVNENGVWDINLIQEVMPHRYPFLLVDRIVELEDRKRVVGIKNVTMNEPFFTGHFPGHPIMPAVLIIEAMAQTGGVMLLNTVEDPKQHLVYFTKIDKAKFRRPVIPGDQLRFELEFVSLRRGICTMNGKAYVEDQLAAEAELQSVIVER